MIFNFASREKEIALEYNHYYIMVKEKPYYERINKKYYYTPHILFDIYLIHNKHVYFYIIPDGTPFKDAVSNALDSLKLYLCKNINDKYLPEFVYKEIAKLFKTRGCEIINGFITANTTHNFHSQQKLY